MSSSDSHHKHHGLFHHHKDEKNTVPVQVGVAQVPIVENVPVHQTHQTSATVVNEPAQVIRTENAAALAEERILRKEEQHLQPVITRDVERTEVHQIAQPVHETAVLPTQQRQEVLAQQNVERNFGAAVAPMAIPQAARIEGEKTITQVEHAPIIQERLHTKVVEEVQPMIYREVIAPEVTTITQPIHERIVEAPVVTQTTAPMIDRGMASGVATTGFATTGTTGHVHKHDTHAHNDHSHKDHSHKGKDYISGDYVNSEFPTGGTQIREGIDTTAGTVHQTYKGERLGEGKLIDQTGTGVSNISTGQAK